MTLSLASTPLATEQISPCRIVVMGVSGSGKTTLATSLAQRLGWRFVEGDNEHSPENIAKMAAGQPLTDADRAGWLQRLSAELREARNACIGEIISCSALKRSYRDVLRQGDPATLFVHLHGAPELIARRLGDRQGHYMPATLLQSQMADLQLPADDESVLSLDPTLAPDALVDAVCRYLGLRDAT